MGTLLLMVGLLGAWSCDGVRDGFHIAQTGQSTWYPDTYGNVVSYDNYHDYVLYQSAFVAMSGVGAYLWSKDNPEWWRVAGVTVGTSLVGWLAREWIIDYIPTGDAFRESEPWKSAVFGKVPDNSTAYQVGVGLLGAGIATAAILIPDHKNPRAILRVTPNPEGLDIAVHF